MNQEEAYQFKMENLSYFTCPKCSTGKLKPNEKEISCESCKADFPIIDGIPRIVELDNYSESFGYQWNIHAATQLDSHSNLPISEVRLFAATGWEEKKLPNQRILEAGSGAGRFTEVLVKTDADVYSFDFSRAVDANARSNGKANNLNLFQGDIFKIPFPDQHFDHVFCLGVLQHTPDPKGSFVSLTKKVKPGGSIYIDVYTRSWYHLLSWKYLLRPLTKNMKQETLYKIISLITPPLVPISRVLRKMLGRFGARMMPIVEYSHLGLDKKLNVEWAILDTFDMYSPAHDHPQTMESVKKWFSEVGFTDVKVWYGDNGVVGRGKRPL